MEYLQGYKFPERIILVKSSYCDKAFVVDPNIKGQLETAKEWARFYDRDIKQDIEGEIFEFENKGFEAEFYEAAKGSSQGGKLSFWNFKISKDGNSWIIGINQDLLLELIKSSTIINGKLQEKVSFIKKNGNTGIVVKDSPLYNECMNDLELRHKKETAKKTTKWIPGYFYESLTRSSVYITDYYIWYEEIKESWYSTKIKILKEPKKVKIVLDDFYFNSNSKNCQTFSGAFKENDNLIRSMIEYNQLNKLPLRSQSDRKIVIDLSIDELEEKRKEYINNLKLEDRFYNQNICKLLLGSFINKKEEISENDYNKYVKPYLI